MEYDIEEECKRNFIKCCSLGSNFIYPCGLKLLKVQTLPFCHCSVVTNYFALLQHFRNEIAMATEIGSPPRFFHMPRFQHQAPRQLFYKRPDFAQQQAMQQLTFDGKRMRKAVNRKTIDYNPSVIKYLEVSWFLNSLKNFLPSFLPAIQDPDFQMSVEQSGILRDLLLHLKTNWQMSVNLTWDELKSLWCS